MTSNFPHKILAVVETHHKLPECALETKLSALYVLVLIEQTYKIIPNKSVNFSLSAHK